MISNICCTTLHKTEAALKQSAAWTKLSICRRFPSNKLLELNQLWMLKPAETRPAPEHHVGAAGRCSVAASALSDGFPWAAGSQCRVTGVCVSANWWAFVSGHRSDPFFLFTAAECHRNFLTLIRVTQLRVASYLFTVEGKYSNVRR